MKIGRLRKAFEKVEEWVDSKPEHLEFCQETITQINRTKNNSCPYPFKVEAEKKTSVF